jgi:hypothetical protein
VTEATDPERIEVVLLRDDPVVAYAGDELANYLQRMCDIECNVVSPSDRATEPLRAIRLGLHGDFGLVAPPSEAPDLDDAIHVDVVSGNGLIAGRNPRSVLLGVYRFLEENGCTWVRPGPDGEAVPNRDLADLTVALDAVPSYRHRGLCIEGAVSLENMVASIEWAPRVGLNSYMLEFLIPYTFFDRWYSHLRNPYRESENVSLEAIARMTEDVVAEIRKRGLTYHAVGHGWTCEPFGIPGLEWAPGEFEVDDHVSQLLAKVNGKRTLHRGIPLNTNLCYSNPEARGAVVDFAVGYARAHPQIGMLHVWLADGYNNHCECADCRGTLPSDLYIRLLNEMDEAFTANGIATRIAFIAYQDLLWPPESERLANPDRFSLLYAPITRSYSRSFDTDTSQVRLPPYKRNRIRLPSDVTENLAYLHGWQLQFEGDAFAYEYYFMWDHYFDPAYFETARVLHEDVRRMRGAGLNGIISDQTQRAYFPTGIGMYVMAKTLWDADVQFDELTRDYFSAAFGGDGDACRAYMAKLSHLFNPPYLRGDCAPEDGAAGEGGRATRRRAAAHGAVNDDAARDLAKIPGVVDAFRPVIERNKRSSDPVQATSWHYLGHHAEIATRLAAALQARARGNWTEAISCWDRTADYVQRHEGELQPVLDVFLFVTTLGRLFAFEQGD